MTKKSSPANTQTHMEIAHIAEGVIILKDGSLRMVLLATSLNFALKSEQEQNALVFAYQSFLNSLNFPIQIIMQSRRLDLDRYLTKLNGRLDEETNELIKLQIADYIEYIQKLLTLANIMDKRFYIVAPFSPPNVKKRSLFDKIFHPAKMITPTMSEQEFKTFRDELLQKANVLSSGLGSLGIRTAALSTQELVELFYATYNPEEASKEKLSAVEDLESPIVGK